MGCAGRSGIRAESKVHLAHPKLLSKDQEQEPSGVEGQSRRRGREEVQLLQRKCGVRCELTGSDRGFSLITGAATKMPSDSGGPLCHTHQIASRHLKWNLVWTWHP